VHGNTARLVGARGAGDAALARICGTVAADEKRHEAAYTHVVGKLFDADPDASVRAMAYMMRRRIDMPTAFINDGRHSGGDFYARFIAIAQQAGTYTVSDYRGILEHLIRQWGVEELEAGLTGEGRRARDYLSALPYKIKRMEEKAHDKAVKAQKKPTPIPINWIFDRTIPVILP
jgi:acyl-[acyl-carrier-protein] desaturase